jgi:hypothetical protein
MIPVDCLLGALPRCVIDQIIRCFGLSVFSMSFEEMGGIYLPIGQL